MSRGGSLLKISTISQFLRALRVLALLALVVHFSGVFQPDSVIRNRVKRSLPKLYTQFFEPTSQFREQVPASSQQQTRKRGLEDSSSEDLCLPMGEKERRKISSEAGADVIRFLENLTNEFHSTNSPEAQLQILGTHFDHLNWSRALMSHARSSLAEDTTNPHSYAPSLIDSAFTKDGAVTLQSNLSHAILFLGRYNRIVEMTRRHERSALSAFRWADEIRHEMVRQPARVLIQKYHVAICGRGDSKTYGCHKGEKIFLVKSLLSPRLACRFPDKRQQYVVTYWVRVREGVPRVLEVESLRERLVKKTYDEQANRRFAAILSPDLDVLLSHAGIVGVVPLRAVMIWRDSTATQTREPASTKLHFQLRTED
jgi:hypothetical protein